MDCELLLLSNLSYKSLGEMIERITNELANAEVSVNCNEEEIIIGSEYFSLALEIEDTSDISFVRNHYNLDVNVCLRVQLFSNTFYLGLELLFKMMGKLMKQIDGNLLFLEDGSDQLLRKENGELIINKDLNQYQTKYLSTSLLSLLDHPYTEKKLSN
ncbi:hypothetical protein [Paenibacillus sp. FSL H8-0034]|uniref:hypothetical protein n=1 Tax=Paenibacillus sp. FSL H8-0034 TaxID=2954671 RepID=UPI0030FB0626